MNPLSQSQSILWHKYDTLSAPILRQGNPEVVRFIASIENGQLENLTEVDVTTLVSSETERIVWFDLPPEALLVDLWHW